VALLVVLGLFCALAPALAAGFALCGISGCSGGGFGRATNPPLTLSLLAVSGAVAGLPLLLYAAWCHSARLVAAAVAGALLLTLTVGWAIGANWRGCPRHISHETCLSENDL
jgi:hypothetical protein